MQRWWRSRPASNAPIVCPRSSATCRPNALESAAIGRLEPEAAMELQRLVTARRFSAGARPSDLDTDDCLAVATRRRHLRAQLNGRSLAIVCAEITDAFGRLIARQRAAGSRHRAALRRTPPSRAASRRPRRSHRDSRRADRRRAVVSRGKDHTRGVRRRAPAPRRRESSPTSSAAVRLPLRRACSTGARCARSRRRPLALPN